MVQPCGQLQRRRSCDSNGTACARRGETAGARAPGAAQALAFRFSLAGRAADRRACTGNGTAWGSSRNPPRLERRDAAHFPPPAASCRARCVAAIPHREAFFTFLETNRLHYAG